MEAQDLEETHKPSKPNSETRKKEVPLPKAWNIKREALTVGKGKIKT